MDVCGIFSFCKFIIKFTVRSPRFFSLIYGANQSSFRTQLTKLRHTPSSLIVTSKMTRICLGISSVRYYFPLYFGRSFYIFPFETGTRFPARHWTPAQTPELSSIHGMSIWCFGDPWEECPWEARNSGASAWSLVNITGADFGSLGIFRRPPSTIYTSTNTIRETLNKTRSQSCRHI